MACLTATCSLDPLAAQTIPHARYFVVLRSPADSAVVRDSLASVADSGSVRITGAVVVFTAPAIPGPMARINRWAHDSLIQFGQPDVATPLDTTAHPGQIEALGTSWSIHDVGADSAHALGAWGQGVKLGILDTGFGPNGHLPVDQCRVFNFAMTPSTDCTDDVSGCGGHGTHTAGTIHADTASGVGIAPRSIFYAAKVFDAGCEAWLSSQLNALGWMLPDSVRVISVSIGNTTSYGYDNAVNVLRHAGALIVAAIGNNGNTTLLDPAMAGGAVGIGSISTAHWVSGWSNYPPSGTENGYPTGVQFVAPGENTVSLCPTSGLCTESGTSMATPVAAASIALVWAYVPRASPDSVLRLMCATALPLGSASDPGMPAHDNYFGCGEVRPDHALRALIAAGGPTIPAQGTVSCNSTASCSGCATVSGTTAFTAIATVGDSAVTWMHLTVSGRQVCWTPDLSQAHVGDAPLLSVVAQ